MTRCGDLNGSAPHRRAWTASATADDGRSSIGAPFAIPPARTETPTTVSWCAPSSPPGEQFVIKREALQRIKRAFDAAGIRFVSPTVTVQWNGAAAPDEAARQAAANMALQPAPANDAPIPA
jgi:hypothetical protein